MCRETSREINTGSQINYDQGRIKHCVLNKGSGRKLWQAVCSLIVLMQHHATYKTHQTLQTTGRKKKVL